MYLSKTGKKAAVLCLSTLFCCALLCGCGSVKFDGGKFPVNAEEISLVLQDGESALLDGFEQLKSADLSGSVCYEEIVRWAGEHPEVSVRYTVELPGGLEADNSAQSLDLSQLDAADIMAASELFGYLPELKSVELGGEANALSPGELQALISAHPGIDFSYSFTVLGQSCALNTETLDLSSASHQDAAELLEWLPCMSSLKTVDLGSDSGPDPLSWEDISAFHAASPDTELLYDFKLYGKSFSLSDERMDLNHIAIYDEGELVKTITACMPNLTYLDMDSCGVSDESMALIRDSLPNADVVWRIWFGEAYSVRTDVKMILASNPGLGGELTAENTRSLKYCTKVTHLDLGHNSYMSDISFISCMPDLEVVIVAMGSWSDVSPLANCPKLEYAEIQTSALNDLSPLSGLKNLRHVNIGYCFALHDISPLYELTELERLWVGCLTPIPQEQIDKMQECAPNCVINTTTFDPCEEGWRYTGWNAYGSLDLDERYALLREQFRYADKPYAYYWNDPLYFPHD